jgi:hypothetical protein
VLSLEILIPDCHCQITIEKNVFVLNNNCLTLFLKNVCAHFHPLVDHYFFRKIPDCVWYCKGVHT